MAKTPKKQQWFRVIENGIPVWHLSSDSVPYTVFYTECFRQLYNRDLSPGFNVLQSIAGPSAFELVNICAHCVQGRLADGGQLPGTPDPRHFAGAWAERGGK